jgi:PAS domain S-box-containing protein
LFQQHALLAQSQSSKQQPLVPAIMMPGVTQQGQDVQSQAQQFAFASDPAAFLRQLQVAQLQQQFNAVQQSRSLPQQGMQPQIQFPAQVSNVTTGPAPAPNQAPAPKRSRAAAAKKAPPTSSATSSRSLAASKAPLVSASDTDCESRHIIAGSKMISKVLLSTDDMSESTENKTEVDLSHLSPEEKARANRDRNREHARNTRLRKKAYLEKLKATVDELCRERDTLVSERAGAATILVEMHNTRTEVLMSFFALRSANEKRRELWASILDESCFACVMPVTPYRSFPASEVQVSKCQRTILGIDGMMSDTSSLHVLLNSLVDRSRFPDATIVFRYTLVTEEAVVAGNQMMARWVMTTLNATQCGARMEVAKQGMLCCKFNSAHKIIGLELMFDVMALMLQLKQAAGSDTFSVIPNTVQTCQRSFDKPMVMTLAEEPYTIVQVNKLWEEMTGYKAEEVVGKASCRLLEGEDTEAAAVESLMTEVRFKRPASAMIIRYKKNGERFQDFFHAYPLSTDSRITHYLFLSSHIQYGPSLVAGAQQSNQGLVQSVGTANATPQGQSSFYGLSALPSTSMSTQPAVVPQGAQGMFNVPAVLSNSMVVATPHGAILPQGIEGGTASQNSHVGGIKRHLTGGENGPTAKQIKTMCTPISGNGTTN